jgi:hypothetical protein
MSFSAPLTVAAVIRSRMCRTTDLGQGTCSTSVLGVQEDKQIVKAGIMLGGSKVPTEPEHESCARRRTRGPLFNPLAVGVGHADPDLAAAVSAARASSLSQD